MLFSVEQAFVGRDEKRAPLRSAILTFRGVDLILFHGSVVGEVFGVKASASVRNM